MNAFYDETCGRLLLISMKACDLEDEKLDSAINQLRDALHSAICDLAYNVPIDLESLLQSSHDALDAMTEKHAYHGDLLNILHSIENYYGE